MEGMLSVDIDDLDLHKVPCVGEATGAEVGAQRSTHRGTSNLREAEKVAGRIFGRHKLMSAK